MFAKSILYTKKAHKWGIFSHVRKCEVLNIRKVKKIACRYLGDQTRHPKLKVGQI